MEKEIYEEHLCMHVFCPYLFIFVMVRKYVGLCDPPSSTDEKLRPAPAIELSIPELNRRLFFLYLVKT